MRSFIFQSDPSLSIPAFSAPAFFSPVIRSFIFQSRIFSTCCERTFNTSCCIHPTSIGGEIKQLQLQIEWSANSIPQWGLRSRPYVL